VVAGHRDRDSAGRAHNARPRDQLGRPLERDAPGVAALPEHLSLSATQSLTMAQELLEAGQAFTAHEVLEAAWKQAPSDERELWRGLAQIAVGVTHAQRGNAPGAVAVLERGAGRVRGYAPDSPYGVDTVGVADWAQDLANRVQADGIPPAAELVPRLRR
jgi:hypothetical protein